MCLGFVIPNWFCELLVGRKYDASWGSSTVTTVSRNNNSVLHLHRTRGCQRPAGLVSGTTSSVHNRDVFEINQNMLRDKSTPTTTTAHLATAPTSELQTYQRAYNTLRTTPPSVHHWDVFERVPKHATKSTPRTTAQRGYRTYLLSFGATYRQTYPFFSD